MRLVAFLLLLLFPIIALSQGSEGSIEFDGSTESINLGNQVANNCRTIEMWFKPHQNITASNTVVTALIARDFNNGNGASTHEFGLYFSPTSWGQGGRLTFARREFSTIHFVHSDATGWNAYRWYHVAVTMHPVNGMTMYVNGVPQQITSSSTAAIGTMSSGATDDVYIGRWGHIDTRHFDGEIDEVRIWEDARTETEIRSKMCSKLQGNEAGLRAYYTFDGNSNTSLGDFSTNTYDGSFVNINSSNRLISGAPIGDTSVYHYAALMNGVSLQMSGNVSGSFEVFNIDSAAKGVQIYKVNSLPNSLNNLYGGLSAEYFGVFLCDQNAFYSIDYDFNGPLCQGCEVLFARNDNAKMNWSNLNLTASGCSFTTYLQSIGGTVYREEYLLSSSPPTLDLGADTTLCEGSVLYLKSVNGGGNFSWSDGSTGDSMLVTQSGTYWAEMTGACSDIDTVEVVFLPAPQVDLGPDSSFCEGTMYTIDASCGADSYLWNTGSTDSVLQVSQAGTYWVEVGNSLCSSFDTIQLVQLFLPASVSLADQNICEGDTATFEIVQPGVSILWSDGSAQVSNSYTQAGTYWVEVSNGCGSHIDSFDVVLIPYPQVDLGSDISLCTGDTAWLDASCNADSYVWNTGSTDSVIAVTQFGAYSVEAANHACVSMDDIQVHQKLPPDAISFDDQLICDDDVVELSVVQNSVDVLWSDGSTQLSNTLNQQGTYWVEVSNSCGAESDTFTIEVRDCNCDIYIPDAFTPNNDGLNDFFRPILDCIYTDYQLKVFNRWGQLLFVSDDAARGWSGYAFGRECPEGVYVYHITYTDFLKKTKSSRGRLVLVR